MRPPVGRNKTEFCDYFSSADPGPQPGGTGGIGGLID